MDIVTPSKNNTRQDDEAEEERGSSKFMNGTEKDEWGEEVWVTVIKMLACILWQIMHHNSSEADDHHNQKKICKHRM